MNATNNRLRLWGVENSSGVPLDYTLKEFVKVEDGILSGGGAAKVLQYFIEFGILIIEKFLKLAHAEFVKVNLLLLAAHCTALVYKFGKKGVGKFDGSKRAGSTLQAGYHLFGQEPLGECLGVGVGKAVFREVVKKVFLKGFEEFPHGAIFSFDLKNGATLWRMDRAISAKRVARALEVVITSGEA